MSNLFFTVYDENTKHNHRFQVTPPVGIAVEQFYFGLGGAAQDLQKALVKQFTKDKIDLNFGNFVPYFFVEGNDYVWGVKTADVKKDQYAKLMLFVHKAVEAVGFSLDAHELKKDVKEEKKKEVKAPVAAEAPVAAVAVEVSVSDTVAPAADSVSAE